MRLMIAVIALLFAGCAANELRKEAMGVVVSRSPAPAGCKFVGMIVEMDDSELKSNRGLAQGALNRLRNTAVDGGANYVILEDSQANTFDAVLVGGAYQCPIETLALGQLQPFTILAPDFPAGASVKKRDCVTKKNYATGKDIEVCR
jgi:hypothetical protein